MPDDRSPAARSDTMRRVKARGTSCENLLAAEFRRLRLRPGARAATPARRIRGDPDFVFRRARVAVFVDGCFWHACPHHCRMPGANRAYWTAKIARNASRDRRITRELRASGWLVIRAWEHAVRADAARIARRVARAIADRNTIPTWTSPPPRPSRPAKARPPRRVRRPSRSASR